MQDCRAGVTLPQQFRQASIFSGFFAFVTPDPRLSLGAILQA
jgi:hypothetical protein